MTQQPPQENPQATKQLNALQIGNLILRHRRTISQGFEYDLSDKEEFLRHWRLVYELGNNYTAREFRTFEIDDNNRRVMTFLLYYFNGCRQAERVFDGEDYRVSKNILLVGEPGTGKTMIMQVFAEYLRLTGNPNAFDNLSVTQMANYYKMHGHIDRYTYNELESKGGRPEPTNICLNDLGLETENQKSYGTSLDSVIDEFLYARYEINQHFYKNYHLTSNLGVKDLQRRFGIRLVDRFKSFNVIPLRGESRRK